MTSSYAKFRDVRFFGSLDGLRAISIIAVIWLHSWWGTNYYDRLAATPVLRQGFFGVQVFFVVSGFLITTLLLREMDRYGTISLRDFYLRRALRIWPLYYVVLAIYVVNALVFERGSIRAHSFLHYLPAFATFTYTWFVSDNWPGGMFNLAWTLATEEQFYLFWPLALRVLRSVWSSVLIVAIIALKIATDHSLTSWILPPGALPTRIVLSVAITICLGVLGAGPALETWIRPPLQRTRLEVVGSRFSRGSVAMSRARTTAILAGFSRNHGAGRSMRGS